MADCCARYARFHQQPHRYEPEHGLLDLETVGHKKDSADKVTVTARSLFLTRSGGVQTSPEEKYDTRESRFRIPRWDFDTYAGGLGLHGERIRKWAAQGAKVLDLAAGLAMFATEAGELDIEVDCADLEFGDDNPMFPIAKQALGRCYAEQLEFLQCLCRHSDNDNYQLDEATAVLLDRLVAKRHEIVDRYPRVSGRRYIADATVLSEVADDTYDAVLCPWLLVHLTEQQEQDVITASTRVTRPGGQLRVRAGFGADLSDEFRQWFAPAAADGSWRVGQKRVKINPESYDDLLVLDVG